MPSMPLPDIDLDGRVVILTGADRGLGRAMALALAEKGARITVASTDAAGLKAVAGEVEAIAGKGHALAVPTDITDLAACQNCLKQTLDTFGELHVLVNNARRLHRDKGMEEGNNKVFWESDPVVYKQTITVNVTGTYYMARTVAPYFIEKGDGKIINLTTSVHNFFRERQSPYGVTKAAIDASSYIWAQDLKDTGVTANALLPGGSCDSDPNRLPRSDGRVLLPVDVMNPVLVWLCSTRSDGHTGGRYNGNLWDPALDLDAAADGCREEPSIRGASR